jgi:hypothetical protein
MSASTDTPVLVFARAPVPGEAKTRLVPVLGAEGAATLSARLARRAIDTAFAAALGQVELWCAPDAKHPFFAECTRRYPLVLLEQGDGDLGARMARALESALSNHPRAVLIGSDCPALAPEDIAAAAGALEAHDVAFVPAEDGGYVLIAARRTDPRLFDAIPWGGGQVMRRTRDRLRELGWRWVELPSRWDVDRPGDLDRLMASGLLPD